jgi:hypothetical protein
MISQGIDGLLSCMQVIPEEGLINLLCSWLHFPHKLSYAILLRVSVVSMPVNRHAASPLHVISLIRLYNQISYGKMHRALY